ncbi:MAG: hypothetical protein HY800_01570 [Ignavibacteriales bacterium]|nr:hypothetical protein [Ignavibacteriales bacterium]
MKTKYQIAENIAKEIVTVFEQGKIFKRIDHQSWVLNYPEFTLPKTNKKAA